MIKEDSRSRLKTEDMAKRHIVERESGSNLELRQPDVRFVERKFDPRISRGSCFYEGFRAGLTAPAFLVTPLTLPKVKAHTSADAWKNVGGSMWRSITRERWRESDG